MTDEAREMLAKVLSELPFGLSEGQAADAILAALTAAGFHLHKAQPWPGPEDGTEILAWREDAGWFTAWFVAPAALLPMDMDTSDYDDEPSWWSTDGEDLSGDLMPTKFAPLPPAPPEPGR